MEVKSYDKHASATLGLFPMVERPWHLPAASNVDLVRIAPAAAIALAKVVPPAWKAPYRPGEARARLLRWLMYIDDLISDSSRATAYFDALDSLSENQLYQAGQWLSGWWSEDDAILVELLWRLELGQKTISAALWLHCVGRG